MNYLTHQLLNTEEINSIKKELEKENQGWEDGKNTAGSHAAKVKLFTKTLFKIFCFISRENFFEISAFLFSCKLFFTKAA